MAGRHWVYLDEARTHEVHAQVEPRARDLLFSTTEFPAGSRDPTDLLVDERVLATTDQLALAMRELEERLALSGAYYRADAADMKWAPLAPPPAARRVDLRPHELPLPDGSGAKMGFHHFHASGAGSDRLLVTLPRGGEGRSILAQLDFEFPRVDDAEVSIVHARLAPSTLKSQLAKRHIELPAQGFAKLVEPRDYEKAFGSRWLDRTRETFRLATHRVLTLGNRAPETKPEALVVPEADALRHALASERVKGVRSLYLAPGERDAMLSSGELGIRRWVQARRRKADHRQVYDLAVLEAALLVEYGLQAESKALLSEEGPRLLRFAAYGNARS